MPAGGPPGQVPIRALTCVDRDWLPGRGIHRRIISDGLGERGLALDQDALGAAVRTVPPCVQGECYPRISPYPLELLPDAYRAVHHGERAPRAVADAEVHHRGEQDASRRRHVGEQDDTVTLEDFVDGVGPYAVRGCRSPIHDVRSPAQRGRAERGLRPGAFPRLAGLTRLRIAEGARSPQSRITRIHVARGKAHAPPRECR